MRRFGFIVFLVFGGCSTAMKDAWFAETVADSRQFHTVQLNALDVHDVSVTAQHKVQHPEVAIEIQGSRTQFEMELAQNRKDLEAVHSSVAKLISDNAGMFLTLAERFSGMPSGGIMAAIAGKIDKVEDTIGVDLSVIEDRLRSELSLTPEDIENMKGMTTEQILAWIASLAASAGIGGVGGSKLGKSRSAEEVLRLNARMRLVEEKK